MKREEINTEVVRAMSSSKLSDLYSIRQGEAESKFDTWLAEVKRESQEQAWEEAWDKIRELPRWWSTTMQLGGFDIGCNADGVATEEGAYMSVREIMMKNPYRKDQ